jgi:hypothetical protein
VVLIGGLATSTLLTLVVVPAMYTIFDDVNEFFRRIFSRLSEKRQLEPEELLILHPNGEINANGVNHVPAQTTPAGAIEDAERALRSEY